MRKTAKQRHHEIISTAYRAKADAFEMEAQAKHRLATRRDNDAFSSSVARATDVVYQSIFAKRAFEGHKEGKSSAWQTIHAIPVAMKNMGKSLSPLQRDILAVFEEWPTFELAELAAGGSVKDWALPRDIIRRLGRPKTRSTPATISPRFSNCIKRGSWRVHLAS